MENSSETRPRPPVAKTRPLTVPRPDARRFFDRMTNVMQYHIGSNLKMLGLINRTIEFKHRDVLIRLYKSLVRPHLEFCTPAWSPHYRKDRDLIEKIQRRFTRMIPNISKLPYDQRLTEVGLWSLEDRRLRADLIEVYKIIHGLSSVSFQSFFEFCHHDRTRGHTLKLHKHSVRTDLRQHFFTERIINVWNKLDEDTVSASSLNSFKRRLQKMYLDESFPRLTLN